MMCFVCRTSIKNLVICQLIVIFVAVISTGCEKMLDLVGTPCHEVQDTACSKPQQRAFKLAELAGLDKHARTVPYMVMLDRCEESGCCPPPFSVCLANDTEQINMRFLIKGKQGFSFTNLTNHTSCSCKIPKRLEEKTHTIK